MLAKSVGAALGIVMIALIARFMMWFIHFTSFGRDGVWPWLNDVLDKIVAAADAKSALSILLVPLLCLALSGVVFTVIYYVGAGVRWTLSGLVTDRLADAVRRNFREYVALTMWIFVVIQSLAFGLVSLLSAHLLWAGEVKTAWAYAAIMLSVSVLMGLLLDSMAAKPLQVTLGRAKPAAA